MVLNSKGKNGHGAALQMYTEIWLPNQTETDSICLVLTCSEGFVYFLQYLGRWTKRVCFYMVVCDDSACCFNFETD